MNLQNQKVVIAGGSSGIGLATARLLSSQKALVTVTGRDAAKLEKLKAEFNTVQLDSGDNQAVKEFFSANGKFHHLILALSGAKGGGLFSDLSLTNLREGFDEKFWPHLQTLQAALPYLEKEGSITIITATSATSKMPGTSGYAAINGALEIMVPILSKELQPLRINAVSPGLVDTNWWNFLNEHDKKEAFAEYSKQIAVGRIGKPEEVASAIVSVLTNEYINGTILTCNGGI